MAHSHAGIGEARMHTMNLVREHEGTEEWLCHDCGRHILVNWNPDFRRTVLEDGDSKVGHNGFKNSVQLEDPGDFHLYRDLPAEDAIAPVDETRLIPWASWMDKSNYSDRWNGKDQ